MHSGMVYSGKIYETEGANPKGVHEAFEVRLLTPLIPGSVRVFTEAIAVGGEQEKYIFQYLNPGNLSATQSFLTIPPTAGKLRFEAYLGVIASQDFIFAGEETTEDAILGYSLFSTIVDDSSNRLGSAGAQDSAPAFGPVITTPEELEDRWLINSQGTFLQLTFAIKVNQVEIARGLVSDFRLSPARALAIASETAPVRAADLIVIGPIVSTPIDRPLTADDEISVNGETLGALTVKLTSPEFSEK